MGDGPPVSLRVPDAPGMSRMIAVMAEGVGQRCGLNAAQAERFAAAVEDTVLALKVIQPTEIAVEFSPNAESIRAAIEPFGCAPGLLSVHSEVLRAQFAEMSNETTATGLTLSAALDDPAAIECHVGYRFTNRPSVQQ